jgi:hypothetical protein
MKKIIWLYLLLLPLIMNGQNYKLFHASSKKLFSDNNPNSHTYSLSFDSSKAVGLDSAYFNFFNVSTTYMPADSCVFWGSQVCLAQDIPSWIGNPVIFNNLNTYHFITRNKDTLLFNFSLSVIDTSIFYRDSSQIFSLIFEGADTLIFNGNTDSVRFYKILHTDTLFNSINSVLDQFRIILGKNYGLMQFFQIDSFPQLLKPMKLIGNNSPEGGLYSLNAEKIFDHQVGDETQWHEVYTRWVGPPDQNYNRFRKYFYLERAFTNDSIVYKVKQELFNNGSDSLSTDTIFLRYSKKSVYQDIPFEKFDGSVRSLELTDYCDTSLWTYTITSSNDLGYCAIDNCWGSIDTEGPVPMTKTVIVAGLGAYDDYSNVYDPSGWYKESKISYFKKVGVSCGTESFAGITETETNAEEITLFPNPSEYEITLKSTVVISEIEIFDYSGKLVIQEAVNSNEYRINTSFLPDGVYFIKTGYADNLYQYQKFIVMKRH